MTVRAFLGAIVKVLHDDSLAAGIAALQEHHNLVRLQELHHGASPAKTSPKGREKRRVCEERKRVRDELLRKDPALQTLILALNAPRVL
jgi:hypothetical protein